MIKASNAVKTWALIVPLIGVVLPRMAIASDCTTAVVALKAIVPSNGKTTKEGECDASLALTRGMLGQFHSDLRVCLQRYSQKGVSIIIDGPPSAQGNRPVVGQIQLQAESAESTAFESVLTIFDPAFKGDVPRSAIQLTPKVAAANVETSSLEAESVTVRESECIADVKVVFVKTEATEENDEFNVRTNEVASSYK
jgi:hypothetical protein